jgi:branched-chain amino acid transport system permease protein
MNTRRLLVAGAGLVIVCLLPFVLPPYLMHIAILILFWGFVSTAWNILGGYAGQHSLGHGLYLGVGAYCSTYLLGRFGLTPWVGLLVALVIAGALGAFVGFATFRSGLKGAYFALVSIALAEAMVYIVSNWKTFGAANGMEVTMLGNRPDMMQFSGKTGYFYVILAFAVVGIALTYFLSRRRFGYRMISVRENEDAAEALGVNSLSVKVWATVLSAVLTAAGGVFYAQYLGFVGPRTVFGEGPSVQILLFAIIGGLGTVWGPAVGALVLVPVAEVVRASLGAKIQGSQLLLYGAILVMVMLFMPRGILGLGHDIRQKFGGKRAERVGPAEMEGSEP